LDLARRRAVLQAVPAGTAFFWEDAVREFALSLVETAVPAGDLHPPAAGHGQTQRLVAGPVPRSGQRTDRASRGSLAGCRTRKHVAGRRHRRLGTRTVLPRRLDSPRVCPGQRESEGKGAEVGGFDSFHARTLGLDRTRRRRGAQALRPMASGHRSEGSDAVARGDRRCPRH